MSLVPHFINTATIATRDFGPRRGASDAHTLQGSVRSEQRRRGQKEPSPGGLRRFSVLASLLLGHSPTSGDAPSSRLARTENRRNKRGRIYETGYLAGALGRSGVETARADQPVVIVLFDNVRAPAADAGTGKGRRIQRGRDAEQVKHRGGVKVHVGAKFFLALHDGLESLADRHPMLLSEPLAEFAGQFPHHRDARVALFVNAVAETHDFLLAR